MSEPKNPNTVVLQNKYYPNGLTEIDIWNFYKNNKNKILNELGNLSVTLFILTNLNKPIVRKHLQKKDLIKLDNSNYEKVITGRTISIGWRMPNHTHFVAIDIDCGKNVIEKKKVDVIKQLSIFVNDKFDNVIKTRVLLSGRGYHFYIYFNQKYNIDKLRDVFKKSLKQNFEDKYYIDTKGIRSVDSGSINLDLTGIRKDGTLTVPWALNINGLICADVTSKYTKIVNRKKYTI